MLILLLLEGQKAQPYTWEFQGWVFFSGKTRTSLCSWSLWSCLLSGLNFCLTVLQRKKERQEGKARNHKVFTVTTVSRKNRGKGRNTHHVWLRQGSVCYWQVLGPLSPSWHQRKNSCFIYKGEDSGFKKLSIMISEIWFDFGDWFLTFQRNMALWIFSLKEIQEVDSSQLIEWTWLANITI